MPYGTIRFDQKTGSYSEQRKYIGQEYDADTGLNYLNARYYNSTIGRFISEDPVFWSFDKSWLADPQNQSSYGYARNNPIVNSDPSGLLTLFVPGTWYNQNEWEISSSAVAMRQNYADMFQEKGEVTYLTQKNLWSGGDNKSARGQAEQRLLEIVNNYPFKDGEQLNIVASSHGGSVAIDLSNDKALNHKIDNLVTLGTPNRKDYVPNYDMIGRHIQVYDKADLVQKFAGGKLHLGLFGGGEFSLARRDFPKAENVNATKQAGYWPKASHSNLWSRQSVFDLVKEQYSSKK